MKPIYPLETRAAAIADYQSGMTLEEVAAKYGASGSGVARWLDLAGVKRRPASMPKLRPCTIEDCPRPHAARGYCRLHYARIIKGARPRDDWQQVDQEARLEDVRWMASTGEGLTGAAERLGISRAALETWLRKYDRTLLVTLTGQDPLPLNTSRAMFHGAGIRVSA